MENKGEGLETVNGDRVKFYTIWLINEGEMNVQSTLEGTINSEIILRKATAQDLEQVIHIFEGAIEKMNTCGIYQWDSIYPNTEILSKDIEKGEMFLGISEGKIVSAMVLNNMCDKDYKNGDWQYKSDSFFVIHRLCVNSDYQGKGMGKRTMTAIEKYLISLGIESIRLDAFSLNPMAVKMYEGLNYKKVGEAHWRKGLFYLYEKKIVFSV